MKTEKHNREQHFCSELEHCDPGLQSHNLHSYTITTNTATQSQPTQLYNHNLQSYTITTRTTTQSQPTQLHNHNPHNYTITTHTATQSQPTQLHNHNLHNYNLHPQATQLLFLGKRVPLWYFQWNSYENSVWKSTLCVQILLSDGFLLSIFDIWHCKDLKCTIC